MIDTALAQRLIAEQFPRWADLPITPVAKSGHDNRTFHLGDDLLIRLPSAERYAAHVAIEQQWLPTIAAQVPLPIPLPIAAGAPSPTFPWPFSINQWLPGENATAERIDDMDQFAVGLGHFLNALRAIDTHGAPPPGQHNFYRGGDLAVYDEETRACIAALAAALQDDIDARAATAVWESALDTTWQSSPVWVHGDVAADNLLVSQGRLCAVIDFGQLAAGDPACDLTIAWTFFSGTSREAFRQANAVDDATWQRARGWGLWKALLQLCEHRGTDPDQAARARCVLEDVLAD